MDNGKLSQFSDDSIASSSHEPNIFVGKMEEASTSATSKYTMNRFSRESEARLMDSVIVNNEKVRYYYNKTLCLREPIGNILDLLEVLHGTTFAYLSQLPDTGDYSIISTLFELIPTISVMSDWNNLNHSCYWEDFCRETKQLMILLDKVNGAALKCCDTATDILNKAQELFPSVVDIRRRSMKTERAIGFRKEFDYMHEDASGHTIQITWKKPGDVMELMWHDADGGLLNVSLNQTGTGFRLRFLRHIIYHAHNLLERAYLILMKLNVALYLHIPIDKLSKCKDVNLKQLTHQEYACLAKAKREFDSSLDLVWQTIFRFKFQTFHLLKYATTFKGMRKASGFTLKTIPKFTSLNISVNDSLLMRVLINELYFIRIKNRVMSSGIQAQANEESFDFTVFPDRTEDMIAKVEDMLAVDNTSCREMLILSNIVRIILPQERPNFTAREKESADDVVALILAHRFQVRRSLKKSLQIFEQNSAFYAMEQIKLLTPVKHVSKRGNSFDANLSAGSGGSETQLEDDGSNIGTRDGNNNENQEEEKLWISVEGGIKVTTDGTRGILTKCPSQNNAVKNYNDLSTDEKVILCVRVLRQLLACIVNEQCLAKISNGKILETKSLVKRLKIKDRQNPDLQKAILEQNKHLRLKLQLTKTMRFLKQKMK